MKGDGTYQLQRFPLRSWLTFFGPLLMVAYYTAICCMFLIVPPQFQVVKTNPVNARWLYYSWFVLSTISLEWAKTGLMNIEAAALMYSRFAPRTALGLMWHTDGKWANPLWWLRALRTGFKLGVSTWAKKDRKSHEISKPNTLWVLLSLTSLLITVALPLSGLTMEFSNVSVYSTEQAPIVGPNETTFNFRSIAELPRRSFRYWQSGRVTSPTYGMLYAPHGTPNVSETYFNDEAVKLSPIIEVFAAPAVSEVVTGQAWGLSANISCALVDPGQLRMLKVLHAQPDKFHFGVNVCYNNPCPLNETWDSADGDPAYAIFPLWFNDTGKTWTSMAYNHVVAADGTQSDWDGPFIRESNHDPNTYDSGTGSPLDEVTTAMFEFFLWELPLYSKVDGSRFESEEATSTAVHCDVVSAVGRADLDPRYRTYSNFIRGNATTNTFDTTIYNPHVADVVPPQVIAAGALANGNNHIDAAASQYRSEPEGAWRALRNALNIITDPPDSIGSNQGLRYNGIDQMLTGDQVLLGIYKLLGESVIALMDNGGVPQWEGDLFRLKPITYLVTGSISWICVLVMLSCWAFLVSSSALWLLVSARPRWAHSLDGNEMFRFGAQYTDEINGCKSTDFRDCSDVLNRVPGMVGVLPGEPSASTAPRDKGFIGLSENEVGSGITYTLNRREAALTRIV